MNFAKKAALLSAASVLTLALGSSAGVVTAAPAGETQNSNDEVRIMVSWSGTAYLTKNAFSNITSSNNLFNDSPQVTNGADSPGNVTVRIKNESGQIVGSEKTIAPGKTVRLDQIPWDSGTYTLQGKGSVTGTYSISIY
ncbi:hypothetical protein ACE41H_21535 [Paenibacillus enshidis]|uniref:Uncharacterized protein n=1 Tax=Paenibacillus enshidis TaxID=1458439 RepID=A0ABV5AYQ0_9BACL